MDADVDILSSKAVDDPEAAQRPADRIMTMVVTNIGFCSPVQT